MGVYLRAVIGRRRVGKTFLIHETLGEHIVFEMTGTQNGNLKSQLRNFKNEMTERVQSPMAIQQPADWQDAFQMLKQYLKPLVQHVKNIYELLQVSSRYVLMARYGRVG
jgi:uncharacterized protein